MRGVWDGTVASIMGLTSLMPTVEAYSDRMAMHTFLMESTQGLIGIPVSITMR